MVICTFLGHREVYEPDMYERLYGAVCELVRKNGEVEFLLHSQGEFYDMCLAAALEVKQHYPQKKITLTWLAWADGRGAAVPPFVIDKIVSPFPPAPRERRDPARDYAKLTRWAIQRSTHLISYVYPLLYEPEGHLYSYAARRALAIQDLTCPETAAFIETEIEKLPERERFLFQKKGEGLSFKQIGELLGVGSASARMSLLRSCRSLRKRMRARLEKARREKPEPPVSCGIFAMGKATRESLLQLEQAVQFLMFYYHVTRFYIAAEYCHTPYMSTLVRLVSASLRRKVQLVAVTHYPSPPAEEQEALAEYFVPLGVRVENIETGVRSPRAQTLRTVKAMMGMSDFCICSLSRSTLGESVGKYLPKVKGLKLLDISKRPGAE